MDFSPKSTFAKGPHAAQWADIASSTVLIQAAIAATAQMQANLGLATTEHASSSNNYKMEGARIFLSILMNLTTPPEETPKRITRDNLVHK